MGEERIALAFAIASQIQASLNLAATRVWCVSECLKTDAMMNTPLVLVDAASDEVVWITTFVVSVQEFKQPLVLPC